MVTISNQLANIIRPSVDCSMWWYRLRGGNITQYIPGKQVLTVEKFMYFIYFIKLPFSMEKSSPWTKLSKVGKCDEKKVIYVNNRQLSINSQYCLQFSTLLHWILIFHREKPQNIKSQSGPRRQLDFIALFLTTGRFLTQLHKNFCRAQFWQVLLDGTTCQNQIVTFECPSGRFINFMHFLKTEY